MWTEAESQNIKKIARSIVPSLRTYAVPQGMQVERGPDATVAHVVTMLDEVIKGTLGLK